MKTLSFPEFRKRYDVNLNAREGDDGFIGRGGFGIVYKAYDRNGHEHVALKRAEPDNHLLDEVRRGSLIPKLPNIAHYKEGFRVTTELGNFDMAVMQYYPAGNLSQLIDTPQPLDPPMLDGLLQGILTGLKHLHEGFTDPDTGEHVRIIHRDLKPQNILIAEYKGHYTPLITDFGISRLVRPGDLLSHSKVENSTGAGSVLYLAPEQVQGGAVKTNLDLWAFGVIVYRMLTKRYPFYAEGHTTTNSFQLAVMQEIKTADLKAVVAGLGNVSDKYRRLIERCLVRDIHKRAQTADELLAILGTPPEPARPQPNVPAERPTDPAPATPARPPVPPRPAPKHPKPNPSIISSRYLIFGGVVLAVLVMVLAALWPKSHYSLETTEAADTTALSTDTLDSAATDSASTASVEPSTTLSDTPPLLDSSQPLALVQQNGKYGFIDKTGTFVIQLQIETSSFSSVPFDFSEGLASVALDGKVGYINKTGQFVIQPQFEMASYFAEGLAFVKQNGKYGYIDKTGQFVIQPQFEDARGLGFSGGLAPVKQNDKFGYIDKTGGFAIQPQFELAEAFHEGLALIRQNGKIGYINKIGQSVIPPQFENAGHFSEGLALVEQNGKWGFIDKTGQFVIQPKFDSAHDFNR